MIKNGFYFGLILLVTLFFTSCEKKVGTPVGGGTTEGLASIQVMLTDSPAAYDQVNVDVVLVKFHHNGLGWVDLETNQGIYDLLELTNGIDTLIASDDLPEGVISQIRLVLGDQNTIMVDSVIHDLEIPSGSTSGLKLNLHEQINGGMNYVFTLDFDAAQSILETGNGQYKLKPVLHLVSTSTLIVGSASGVLDPGVVAPIYAILDGDTVASTFSNDEGYFLLQSLTPGEYTIAIDPEDPYSDVLIELVQIEAGQNVDLGIIDVQ